MSVKVSIIVPVYNVELYLKRCLISILNQTYENIQVIVVNDGSTDSSLAIANEFEDNRVIIVTKGNGGLSSARNEGLKYVEGEYVTFVDSDDWLSLDAIEKMVVRALENNADIVAASYEVTDSENVKDMKSLSKNQVFQGESCSTQLFTFNVKSYTWAKLYRSTLLKNIQFPNGRNYEDIATTYQFMMRCDILVVTSDIVYFYFKRQNGISGTKRLQEVENQLANIEEMLCHTIQNQYWEYYILYILHLAYLYYARLPKTMKSSSLEKKMEIFRKRVKLKRNILFYCTKKKFLRVFLMYTGLIRLLCRLISVKSFNKIK